MQRNVLIRFVEETTRKEHRALILISDAVENAINGPGSKKAFSYRHHDKQVHFHGMTREEAGKLAEMLTECDPAPIVGTPTGGGAIRMVFGNLEKLSLVLQSLLAKIETITYDPLPEAPALPDGGKVEQEVVDQFIQSMRTHGAVFYTEVLYQA